MSPPGRSGRVCALLASLAALAACGDSGGGATPDARPIVVDATIDATIDAVPTARLTVVREGAGSVTSQPAGIDCGSTCSGSFALGTQVTLSPAAPNGVSFTGWDGVCTGTGACVVTLDGDLSVTARFTGIPCADECTADTTECVTGTSDRTCGQYDADSCVEWSPVTACTGADECRLGRCGGAYPLSILPLPEGMTPADVGTVTSMPAGILCGRDGNLCQDYFADGAQVTLSATSDATAVFYGWTLFPLGGTNGMQCVGSTAPCTVSMTEATTLVALYCSPECAAGTAVCTTATTAETCGQLDDDPCLDLGPPTACPGAQVCTSTGCRAGFIVTGQVRAADVSRVAIDGVPCSSSPCSRGVAAGGSATLTPLPASNEVFTGWSGACTGMGPCVLTAAGTATANFTDRCTYTDDLAAGTILGLTLAGTSLYFTRLYDFMTFAYRAPRAGGAWTQLVATSLGPLLVDEPYIYWSGANSANSTVVRYAAGMPEMIVSDATSGDPAMNTTSVFYPKNATLQRVGKAGGAAVQLAAGLPSGTLPSGYYESPQLLADDTSAYWFGGGQVVKVPVGGGAPVTLATTNQVRFDTVAQDATYLYWGRGADLVRIAKAGGAVEVLVPGAEPGGIAVLDTTLVWTGGAGGTSYAFATTIGSGVVTKLSYLETSSDAHSIAIDASRVYIVGAAGAGHHIVRLARTATCAP